MSSHSDSNNKIYDKIIDYKHDKTCSGLNCKDSNTHLYLMSMTIGSSFLCDDCKRSLEHDGWILNNHEYTIGKKEPLRVSKIGEVK